MSKLSRFTASDFKSPWNYQVIDEKNGPSIIYCPLTYAAEVANARLEEFEKSCKKVYGRVDGDFGWFNRTHVHRGQLSVPLESTHVGYIFNIEPINQAVTKDEIVAELRSAMTQDALGFLKPIRDLSALADRIEKFGVS